MTLFEFRDKMNIIWKNTLSNTLEINKMWSLLQ